MVDTPRAHEQRLPSKNARVSVQDELIADIRTRRDIGIQTYGTALQPFNGRDAGRDLVEELIDAAVYAKQLAIEKNDLRAALVDLRALLAKAGEDAAIAHFHDALERHGVVL